MYCNVLSKFVLLYYYYYLKNLAGYFTVIGNVSVYADLDIYPSPLVINGGDLRPGIVVVKGNLLYVLGLTTGFETNIS